MSSEIMVYGYIEIPKGSEGDNARRLSVMLGQYDEPGHRLIASCGDAIKGWRSSTISFARSYKRIGPNDVGAFHEEFETLLQNIKAKSAHLSIEDEEGLEERHLDYAYGAETFEGPPVWVCVPSQRKPGNQESLDD